LQPAELEEISVEQVGKWRKGNDMWVAVLIEPCDKSTTLTDAYLQNGVPVEVKDLIHEYGSVFQSPSTLPPSRQYDHSNSLLPNSVIVNCRL
jgi:hypothetical protein